MVSLHSTKVLTELEYLSIISRLNRLEGRKNLTPINPRKSFKEICEKLSISPSEIKSKSRKQEIIDQCYLAAKELKRQGWSNEKIGKAMNRETSSISHLLLHSLPAKADRDKEREEG